MTPRPLVALCLLCHHQFDASSGPIRCPECFPRHLVVVR